MSMVLKVDILSVGSYVLMVYLASTCTLLLNVCASTCTVVVVAYPLGIATCNSSCKVVWTLFLTITCTAFSGAFLLVV